MRNTQWWTWLVLVALTAYATLTVISEWQKIQDTFVNWPALNFFIQGGILLVLFLRITRLRRWARDTLGEGIQIQRSRYRFLIPSLLILPFVLYVLLSGLKKAVPPATEFSLLVIAPTLGGLVLTAARRKGIRRSVGRELVSVAQKLIVATVLLIIFTSTFFTVDLVGGINPNSINWSYLNVFRWACFWVSTWSFFSGAYLFLLGITDLVFALRRLNR